MALQKNFSTKIDNLDALKKIAASLGLVQTRGRHRGEGSIRRLLEAIAAGEVQVVPASAAQAEDDVDRILAAYEAAGLVVRAESKEPFDDFEPVEIDGPPLSEQIIADRR